MTIDDLVRTFSAGFCHGEKRAECSTCTNRERAIVRVRRMAAAVEAACEIDDEMVLDPDCDEDSMFVRLRNARDALDGGGR